MSGKRLKRSENFILELRSNLQLLFILLGGKFELLLIARFERGFSPNILPTD